MLIRLGRKIHGKRLREGVGGVVGLSDVCGLGPCARRRGEIGEAIGAARQSVRGRECIHIDVMWERRSDRCRVYLGRHGSMYRHDCRKDPIRGLRISIVRRFLHFDHRSALMRAGGNRPFQLDRPIGAVEAGERLHVLQCSRRQAPMVPVVAGRSWPTHGDGRVHRRQALFRLRGPLVVVVGIDSRADEKPVDAMRMFAGMFGESRLAAEPVACGQTDTFHDGSPPALTLSHSRARRRCSSSLHCGCGDASQDSMTSFSSVPRRFHRRETHTSENFFPHPSWRHL